MVEKYGDRIEVETVLAKVVLICERCNASGEKQDYTISIEYSRVA